MSREGNFISTSDKETADILIKSGFFLLSHTGNLYTFVNTETAFFSEDIRRKITFTNKVCL